MFRLEKLINSVSLNVTENVKKNSFKIDLTVFLLEKERTNKFIYFCIQLCIKYS